MELTQQQIAQYHAHGFLLLPGQFTAAEVLAIQEEAAKVITEDSPRRILEKNGEVRSFFAPEQSSSFFAQLMRLERLVVPTRQLLDGDVYVHQTKINTKRAMMGDWWEWHQDFPYWYREDGMPEPRVLTAMIYLNDVTEFNGPMLLIPGSHGAGVTDRVNPEDGPADDNQWFAAYQRSTSYMSALTASLKYTLEKSTVAAWALDKGIVSAKGPAGSVLLFHGNVFHASSNNLSPWDRNTFLITYNSVHNPLRPVDNPRPGFLANRDFQPLASLPDDVLTGVPSEAR